jgi:hypothetical protein
MTDLQISRLVRLTGICHRSEHVFAQAIQSTSCKEFRGCVGRIRQVLHEIRFQLLLELERRGEGVTSGVLNEGEYASAYSNCESSLRFVVESYERVLRTPLPPHTTAMLQRQHQQLEQLYDEFKQFVAVLQGLIDDQGQIAAAVTAAL